MRTEFIWSICRADILEDYCIVYTYNIDKQSDITLHGANSCCVNIISNMKSIQIEQKQKNKQINILVSFHSFF